MARTISTGKEDILNSAKYDVHLRVEVENSTGAMVNLSALSSADWVHGARWDWSLDTPVPELTVTLRRDHGLSTGESLAPLDGDSTFNFNSTAGFAALVDVGRDLNVYTAVTTPGAAAPATSEYEHVFQGEIDEAAWQDTPMQIIARSKNMGRMNDRWIESSTYVYGTSSGTLIATVIEQILDDWTDLSTTILLSTTPSFLIAPQYTPEKQPVLQAITTLAQLIGFNLHEVWSTASTSWRIKFSEPRRAATSSQKDWTFGANDYYGVRQMSVSRADVRNKISVLYGGSTSRAQVIAQSTSSQDQYGVRFMEFEEAINSAINTSSEASVLAEAALDDLEQPPAKHEIEVPYWYPGELGDYYEFEGNGIHYSTNQYLAAYGITQEVSRDRHRTSVRVQGRPAGHRLQWLNYRSGGNLVFAEVLSVAVTFNVNGQAVVSVVGTELIAKNIYIRVGDNTTPADPTAAVNDGSVSGARGVISTTIAVSPGRDAIVKAVAADAAGILGPIITTRCNRRDAPLLVNASSFGTSTSAMNPDHLVTLVSSGLLGAGALLHCELNAYLTGGANAFPSMPLCSLRASPTTNLGAIGSFTIIDVFFGSTNTTQRASGWATLKNGVTSTSQQISETIDYDPPQVYAEKSVTVTRYARTSLDLGGAFYLGVRSLVYSSSQAVTHDWAFVGLGYTT